MEESSLVDAINALVGFLTPEQAKAAMAWLYALSIVYAGVRWFLAKVAPRFAGSAVMVMIDRGLHVLFANSDKLETRSKVAKARLSTPPPPKRSGPPFGFVLTLALGVLLVGCAGTAEQRLRGSLDGALQIAELSYEVASDACDQRGKPARCEAIDVAYERIADIGESALKALDAGRLEQAQDMYRQIAALLRGLRGSK